MPLSHVLVESFTIGESYQVDVADSEALSKLNAQDGIDQPECPLEGAQEVFEVLIVFLCRARAFAISTTPVRPSRV